MKKQFLFLFFLSVAIASAQEKRKAFTLEIVADATQQYEAAIPESPYFVKENILQLYCGEKLLVECEVEEGKIITMKVVETNTHPEKTIAIDFSQSAEDRKKINTTLIVKNPFDQVLHYDALMFTPLSQEWRETSILPIRPKLMNFEMWPHAIVTLVLENWRLE